MENTTTARPDYAALRAALALGTGWGGSAGTSLKRAIASSALLDWGEDNSAASLNRANLVAQVRSWLTGGDRSMTDNFRENWPNISAFGTSMVNDMAANAGLLVDAGRPNARASYPAANWDALSSAIETAANDGRVR